MPYTEDEVYKQENLRFATHEQGRAPTLYFRTGHGSGRLRQEHPDGPKIQDIRMHTSHAFFPTERQQREFAASFSEGMTRSDFRRLRTAHGGRHTPTEGYHHYEASFDAHQGAGQAVVTHRSGGTVVGQNQLSTLRSATSGIYTQMKSAFRRK